MVSCLSEFQLYVVRKYLKRWKKGNYVEVERLWEKRISERTQAQCAHVIMNICVVCPEWWRRHNKSMKMLRFPPHPVGRVCFHITDTIRRQSQREYLRVSFDPGTSTAVLFLTLFRWFYFWFITETPQNNGHLRIFRAHAPAKSYIMINGDRLRHLFMPALCSTMPSQVTSYHAKVPFIYSMHLLHTL